MGNWKQIIFFNKQVQAVFDKTVVVPLVSGKSSACARTGAQGQQSKAQLQLLNPKQGTPLAGSLAYAKYLWTGSGFLVTKTASSLLHPAVLS